jgi:hypothetical protein
MIVEMREVENGFILKLDGYLGEREIICFNIEDVDKEIMNYWEEHSKALEKR